MLSEERSTRLTFWMTVRSWCHYTNSHASNPLSCVCNDIIQILACTSHVIRSGCSWSRAHSRPSNYVNARIVTHRYNISCEPLRKAPQLVQQGHAVEGPQTNARPRVGLGAPSSGYACPASAMHYPVIFQRPQWVLCRAYATGTREKQELMRVRRFRDWKRSFRFPAQPLHPTGAAGMH